MKRITIEELRLRNFRGARDVRVSFAAGTNIVSGDNGTGKSTLMDAFLWLLFGKDAEERKDCEIKRIEAGERLRQTDATVECRLDVDGQQNTLRRSLREVWSKPRGATEPVFKGNETEYTINDVPKKMSEFDAWVAEHLAPADVFRLLTDAGCFPRLKWEKQREKLFELAGGVDEEAVKSSVDGLGDLLARLSGKSLEDYKRELAARKRKLRKALEEIPARSDQTRLMIPTTDARDIWERKLADVDARLAALNREAADFAAEERARGAEARRRVEEVEALKTRMARRTAELRRAAIEEAEKKNEGHRQVEARLRDLKAADAEATRRLKDAKGEVDELALRINQKEAECERLRATWYAESARPYTGDNVCPHCLQPLPEEMQRDNRRRFEESKNERLSQIQTDGHRTKAEITRLEEEMKTAEARLDRAAADAFDAEASAEILREELAEMPDRVEPAAVDPMADEAYRAMADELAAMEADAPQTSPASDPNGGEAITARLAALNRERDTIRRGLSDCDTADSLRAEIRRLDEESRTLAQQLSDADRDEDTMRRYTRARIEAMEQRVNSLFRTVRFRLFEYTNEGGEVDTCVPLVGADGVPYPVANTAAQVWAGLEIIRVLQQHAGVSTPVFVDGAERVTQFPEMDHQAILLRVVEGVRPLRVESKA
jgi:DNA repair exonuclease SbcCD ATPase subunit|nr:MAG TPA: chromosome partition protein [Caudoviricetes sp.]